MQKKRLEALFPSLDYKLRIKTPALFSSWLLHSSIMKYSNYKTINLMEEDEEESFQLPPKLGLLGQLISFQWKIIYRCLASIFSPFLALLSIASHSYGRAEEVAMSVESAVLSLPNRVSGSSLKLVRKLVLGLLGALHVCMVLVAVLVIAVVLGVGLVRLYVEEPVVVKERLFFDYTMASPQAEFGFGRIGVGFEPAGKVEKSQVEGIPAGHWCQVWLLLLMPDSDYNREVGVFQVTTEIVSMEGNVTARSSQPCMLHFRSLPVRLVRTFLMGVPLVLGILEETQRLHVPMLSYLENYPRSKAVRVTISPRAGTAFLPQFYEAEVLVKSQPPWPKQLVRNWKWTFYVWTSIYTFILLVVVLISCCRPLIFPSGYNADRDSAPEEEEEEEEEERGKGDAEADTSKAEDVSDAVRKQKERKKKQKELEGEGMGISKEEVSDIVRRWNERRRKRKAVFASHETRDTAAGSPASSFSINQDDASIVIDDNADSESVSSD